MNKETGIAVGSISLAIGAISISSEQAKGWLDVVQTIAQSPTGLLMFIMLVLVLLAWLLVRQWQGGQECEARIDKLLDAMRTLHTMLSMDERFADQMPTWDEFIDSKIDVRAMNRKPKA